MLETAHTFLLLTPYSLQVEKALVLEATTARGKRSAAHRENRSQILI